MKTGTAPRFFCEHCGAEVGRDDKACPVCGRFFSAVRCPRCGFSGPASRFSDGCPVCGYSEPPDAGWPEYSDNADSRGKALADPLPVWVWVAAVGVLIAAIVAIASVI
ncbi:MAG: zinc ribbon domain-containing protein [Spirochaetales bacterium]|nr:zinc ribbon domain-containing protein [Spirochaetales bacterium]